MALRLHCHHCGTSLASLSLPLRRLDECPQCRAELHVCRMCTRYEPRLPTACREEDAPEVRDKERANFCDFFEPSEDAHDSASIDAGRRAAAELDRLFGRQDDGSQAAGPGDPALDAAEALFRK